MMSLASYLLLFAGEASSGSLLRAFGPMILIFGIFYLFLIMPMRRRQKALQKMVDGLKRGDRVVTNSGIYGEVAAIEDTVIHLKVADKVKIRVARSSIGGLEENPKSDTQEVSQ